MRQLGNPGVEVSFDCVVDAMGRTARGCLLVIGAFRPSVHGARMPASNFRDSIHMARRTHHDEHTTALGPAPEISIGLSAGLSI